MSASDLRSIDLQSIPDAIQVINESSKGTSLEYHLDFFSFLSLKGYWNLSSTHSLLRYIENDPAAVILTCTDPKARDAHILYWGAVPKHRTLRLAQELFEACCARLSDDGYVTLYGVSSPDRPVRRYRFIQSLPQHEMFDLTANSLRLPAPTSAYEVRPLKPGDILQVSAPAAEPYDWSQRPTFLMHAATQFQFYGAFSGGAINAYAVVLPSDTGPFTLIDLRSSESDSAPGYELLRRVFADCAPPYLASNVFDRSYSHRLLSSAGFEIKRRFFSLRRDLRPSSPLSARPVP